MQTNSVENCFSSKQVYDVFLLIGGLYGSALQSARADNREAAWSELSDDFLSDLGKLTEHWRVDMEKPAVSGELTSAKLEQAGRRVSILCRRFTKLQALSHMWLSQLKFTQLIVAVEKCWQDLINSLNQSAAISSEMASQMSGSSKSRLISLKNLETAYRQETEQMQANYKIPVAI